MRWSYKTVHYELKKEGLLGSAFLDESEIERSLNEYGKAGWELISMLETLDGLTAVFKQPLSLDAGLGKPQEKTAKIKQSREIHFPKIASHRSESAGFKMHGSAELVNHGPLLLDDFEVVDESGEENKRQNTTSMKPPIDVGTIRIE